MEATKILERIQSDHENIQNDEPQRFPDAASDGDFFRQGDIYITKRREMPNSCVVFEKPQQQLAPGTTKGSRHCLDSLVGVELFTDPKGDALSGPWIQLSDERVVEHPEHGNVILPVGIYHVTYQRAYAEELRRVAD